MRARRASRTALALGCALGCACATVLPPSPGDPELRHLDLAGNESLSGKQIEARIVSAGTSWVPFTGHHYYDEAILESDLQRVVRLYQAEGYYKARIVERTVTTVSPDKVDVLIRVAEGPPTKVHSRAIEGLDGLPPELLEPLQKDLPTREGERFREEGYTSTKALLAQRLRDAGFAEAVVTGAVVVDEPTERAEVTFRLEPGPRYVFGEIAVAGAEEVAVERIVDHARGVLRPGKTYSDQALAVAQRLVFDLGAFSTVRVTRGEPDRGARVMPVVVTVHEAPFRTLRGTAGLGVDSRFSELPRLGGEWSSRNFLGGLRKFTASISGSLVYLPSLWVVFSGASPTLDVAANTNLRFEQPEIIGRHTSFTSTLALERGVDPAFTYLTSRASVGLLYRYRRTFSLEPSYNFSVFRLYGEAASAVTASSQEAVLDACAAAGQICRLAYLEVRAALDLRDSLVETTRGGYFAVSVQGGSKYLGGGYDYFRVLPEARGYLPLGPLVLAARVQVGVLVPAAGTSSSVLTRFFLGGNTTERGFGNRQLSPSFVACRYRDPKTNACQTAEQAGKSPGTDITEVLPVGGNGMLGANLELRIPLPMSFGVVTFVDAGQVASALDQLSLDGIHVAVGVGLRWRTVFGPVRLDVAYRVNNPPLAFTLASDLPPGAQVSSISRFALQFSIGEAF